MARQGLGQSRKWLVDSTLRDGEQAPLVAFSEDQSFDIALALAKIGLTELEIGIPAMGEREQQKMRRIAQALPHLRTTAWCRARRNDLLAAEQTHVSAVHISVPVSEIQLNALGRNWSWVYDELAELIPLACSLFSYVSIGAQDAARCDSTSLVNLAQYVQSLGANRLRLADTVGVWDPLFCYKVVSEVVTFAQGLHIGVHTHNDLGMATANAVVALAAGAHCVDVTVNGLGERAGNAALEEVVMALELARPGSSAITTSGLLDLSLLVAKYSGRTLADSKAIVGPNAFRHESGIHVHALLRDCRSYEPFAPGLVGHAGRKYVLGKHSGNRARVAEVDHPTEERLPLAVAMQKR